MPGCLCFMMTLDNKGTWQTRSSIPQGKEKKKKNLTVPTTRNLLWHESIFGFVKEQCIWFTHTRGERYLKSTMNDQRMTALNRKITLPNWLDFRHGKSAWHPKFENLIHRCQRPYRLLVGVTSPLTNVGTSSSSMEASFFNSKLYSCANSGHFMKKASS